MATETCTVAGEVGERDMKVERKRYPEGGGNQGLEIEKHGDESKERGGRRGCVALKTVAAGLWKPCRQTSEGSKGVYPATLPAACLTAP